MSALRSRSEELEEKKGITKWWLPVFGLAIAVTLAVMALAIAPEARPLWWNTAPQLRDMNKPVVGPRVSLCRPTTDEPCWGTVDLAMALVIWLLVFAIAMLFVFALVGGESKAEKQAKEIMRQAEAKKKAAKIARKRGRKSRK